MSALPSLLFADTSFYYAVFDSEDPSYLRAQEYAQWLEQISCQLISTWEIILETVTLLRYRHSYQASLTFIKEVLPTLQVFHITHSDRQQAFKLFEKLSADKKLSLCDVISYWVITHHLKNIPCLAFDRDFKTLGLTMATPFKREE